MSKDDRQIRIDQYLTNQLDSSDRREFEEEVSRNAALSDQLADTELAMAAIELAEDNALKTRLQKLEADNYKQQAGATPGKPMTEVTTEAKVTKMQPRNNRRFLFGIAAAVLLLLAAGWFLMQPKGFDSPAALAMATYEPYENITAGTVRGDTNNAATTAFSAYDAGNYEAAAAAFTNLPPTAVHKFYLGQSLLATEKYPAAIAQFTDLTKASFGLQKESGYFLALAHLGAENIDLATDLLTQIQADSNHPMQEKAATLLQEINALK